MQEAPAQVSPIRAPGPKVSGGWTVTSPHTLLQPLMGKAGKKALPGARVQQVSTIPPPEWQ
eukprot:7532523-Karenia_brevis.AAC.1